MPARAKKARKHASAGPAAGRARILQQASGSGSAAGIRIRTRTSSRHQDQDQDQQQASGSAAGIRIRIRPAAGIRTSSRHQDQDQACSRHQDQQQASGPGSGLQQASGSAATNKKWRRKEMDINILKVFLPVELYFVDNVKKALYRFAITDNLPGLLDILQLVIDSRTSGLEDVVILDPARPGKVASAARIGEHYGLRKRSFDEQIENVRTWTITEA